MDVSDFDFHLPPELVAQTAVERGKSRLLVLNRESGATAHRRIRDLPDYLRPGDLMGALGNDAGLTREQVGKIHIGEFTSWVALARDVAQDALVRLNDGNPAGADYGYVKGRAFRMRLIEG